MNKKYTIRPEEEKDYDTIYSLIKTAFSTAKNKNGSEQDFASNLRKTSGYIPQLALVVEDEQLIIAHLMLTKINIQMKNGSFRALMLAPISVLLKYRNQGVGSSLIIESFSIAKTMGYSAVLLCGDPEYYKRFGFKSASLFKIYNTDGIPDEYVLACELEKNTLEDISGSFSFF